MERLGHSDITITLNVYGHLFPSLEEKLTEGLDELYQQAERAPRKVAAVASIGSVRSGA